MPLTFQDGFTKDSITGQVIGVGDLTGGGIPASSNGNPNITLPGGQIISGSDPNYGAYAAQQATMSGSQLTSSQIPIGGYVPGGNRSALPTTITNNQIPSALPDIKTASALSSKDTNLSNEATLLKAQNDALKASQANATQPGQKISGPSGLQGLSEKDIARTTTGDIYRRDLAAEQNALSGWIEKNGKPVSNSDWLKFHDSVYKGTVPGGRGDGGPSDQPAGPTVAADDLTISLEKWENLLKTYDDKIKADNEMINNQYSNIRNFQAGTQEGVDNIGQQLGRTATLVQGEQLALQQQRQRSEQQLLDNLDILVRNKAADVEDRGYALDSINMKMQVEQKIYDRKRDIIDDARSYRLDQQNAITSFASMAAQIGLTPGSKGANDMIAELSKQSGVPATTFMAILSSIENDMLLSQVKKASGGSGGASGFTSQEKRKLEQLGLLDAPRQDQLDALYGSDGSTEDVDFYIQQYLDGNSNIVDEDGNIKYSSIPAKLRVAFGERLAEVNDYNTALENNQIDYGWSGNGSFGNFVDKTTSVVNRFMNMF